jgi:cytochrome c553
VTEIPEHLLKRSRDRRAGGGDSAGASGGDSSAAPVPATSSTPAVKAAAPSEPVVVATKPDAPHVAAAKSRGKIPYWAMATLSLLPIFLFMYVRGLQPQKAEASGPIAIGIENYGSCASCHGANGGGGAGRVFANMEALKTFPHIEDMLNWVYVGTEGYEAAGVATYGDPNREGGAHAPRSYNGSAMPAQGAMYGGALTEYEILGLVCHIRYDLAGADANGDWAEEYEKWCSEESAIFVGLEDGSVTFDSLPGVGTAPRLGTSADEEIAGGE